MTKLDMDTVPEMSTKAKRITWPCHVIGFEILKNKNKPRAPEARNIKRSVMTAANELSLSMVDT
jgi:hypothetical protein